MPTHSFTTIDLDDPADDEERDEILSWATARESTARAGRYYVDLPGSVTIYANKPLLHEILTRALAALHADDEPAAEPELVHGDVVAIRVPPTRPATGTPNWELEAIGQQVINGLPRSAA